MHHEHPELVKDQYWDEVFPPELPYTLAAEPFREHHPEPSTANINVKPQAQGIVTNPSSVKIDGLQSCNDVNSAIMFTAKPSSGNLQKRGSQTSMIPSTSVPGKGYLLQIQFESNGKCFVRSVAAEQLGDERPEAAVFEGRQGGRQADRRLERHGAAAEQLAAAAGSAAPQVQDGQHEDREPGDRGSGRRAGDDHLASGPTRAAAVGDERLRTAARFEACRHAAK